MSKWGNAGTTDVVPDKPFRVFGQCELDFGYFAYVKGAGAEPYDAQLHKSNKHACMVVRVYPIMDMNWDGQYERRYEITQEDWVRWVRPSIEKATGKKGDAALDAVHGAYVSLEDKPTGRKYKSNELDADNKPVYKDKTAANFLAIFKDESECSAACLVYRDADTGIGDDAPFEANGGGDSQLNAAIALASAMKGAGQGKQVIEAALTGAGHTDLIENPAIQAIIAG